MSDSTNDRTTGQPSQGRQNPYATQDPYAQNPYAQNAYGQNPYGQQSGSYDPYGQATPGQDPHAQNPYAQNPYVQNTGPQNTYAQDPYAQDPYAQATGQAGYGQPYPTSYGQPPYGTMIGYGTQAVPMRPSMGFGQAFKAYFQNYARFDGRAGLSEYWWVQLAYALITLILYVGAVVAVASDGDDGTSGGGTAVGVVLFLLLGAWFLATIVPSLALTARRLHDTNKSGWLQLIQLVPFVGNIIMIVLCCGGSNPAGAQFDGPEQPRLGAAPGATSQDR